MFKRLKKIFETIWDFSKLWVFITLAVKTINLASTYALLYLNKLLLNKISDVIRANGFSDSSVIKLIGVICFVDIAFMLVTNFFQYQLGKIKMTYDDKLSVKIALSMVNRDMSCYDTPEHFNEVKLAYQYCNSIFSNFNNSIDFIFCILSFTLSLTLIVRVNFVLAIIAILSILPSFVVRKKIKMRNYNIDKQMTKDKRYIDYLTSMLLNKLTIKEIQIYNYQDYIKSKIEESQEECRDKKIKNSLFNARCEFALAVYEKIISFSTQVLLVFSIVSKKLTIGDYSYIGGLISNLKNSFNRVVSLITEINITDRKYKDYINIVENKEPLVKSGDIPVPKGLSDFSIAFNHVSFKYPNAENYTLKDINFEYRFNSKFALVGQNGSGKTTLIKLLLRFYDPTEGEILLNGINIKRYDLVQYRRIFSAMFHEILIYHLTIAENITISDIHNYNQERIFKVLDSLHLTPDLEIDLNREYGREFSENGYVFSAGQQQRLYAARTLYKDSDVYVLDEPAASMDAISESKFFHALNSFTVGKGLIYITHRYGILDKMDKILVLDKGILIESGTHEELIRQKGLYYKMFELQQKEFTKNLEGRI